jgi:hypothetical protein
LATIHQKKMTEAVRHQAMMRMKRRQERVKRMKLEASKQGCAVPVLVQLASAHAMAATLQAPLQSALSACPPGAAQPRQKRGMGVAALLATA